MLDTGFNNITYNSSNFNYSVALCTYNGEKYIKEQLISILEQTLRPSEIVISDDGSSDCTLTIVDAVLKDCGIKYRIINNGRGRGVTNNFINAISNCSCDYVFTSDQDDVWMSDKAENIKDVFERNENALLVFTNGILVDSHLKSLNSDMWSQVGITEQMIEQNIWFEYLLNKCMITGATMAFRKSLFDYEEKIPDSWLHDGWLAIKAAIKHGLVPCSKELIQYRLHDNNVVGMNTVDIKKSTKSYFSNFRKMRDVHLNRYQRYLDVKNHFYDSLTSEQNKALEECITFWKDLITADNTKNRIKRLNLVIYHLNNKDFDRFSNGTRGAFREIYLALFK